MMGDDGDCPNVHAPASPGLKLLPVTAMLVPIGAELGVRTMNGVLVVTFRVAAAESPVEPVTVIVYVPGVAPELILNPLPTT